MRILTLLLAFVLIQMSCTEKNDNKYSYYKGLQGALYDSVQLMVKYGKDYWSSNRFYLLEYLANRNDTIDLKLTVLPKEIEHRFLNYCYLYNEDSTFLLIKKGNPVLAKDANNRIGDIIDQDIVKDSVFVIFNPPVWRLIVTVGEVVVDRNYAEAEIGKYLKDTMKFIPPKLN